MWGMRRGIRHSQSDHAKICPAEVYRRDSGLASAVAEDECLACRACEIQCEEGAITVKED